ncbi:unnamed protein product [Soboliphyme baturini]|uniref:Neur_chan_memb domain-containing protein n=1 Tax=Soboliphyme baturini TaxID=241478 RepID=A0A183IG78_9BILA|nr:unnamed protein product [Soboliphyme baturini]
MCRATRREYYGPHRPSTDVFKPAQRGSCPIKQLPLSDDQYLACTMVLDSWYLIRFHSRLDTERKATASSITWCRQVHLRATDCRLLLLALLNDITPFSIRVSITALISGAAGTTAVSLTELLTEKSRWVVRKLSTNRFQNISHVCYKSSMGVRQPLIKEHIITDNPSLRQYIMEKRFCAKSRASMNVVFYLIAYVLNTAAVLAPTILLQ